MEFLEEVYKKFKSTGQVVTRKTQEITKVAKLKIKLNDAVVSLDKEHMKLGALMYDFFKSGKDISNEDVIASYINNIDNALNSMKEIQNEIDSYSNDIVCDICDTVNLGKYTNCRNCGNKLHQ